MNISQLTRSKTRLVAVYPDHRFHITLVGGCWEWNHGKSSFPQSAALDHVREEGGEVIREPNPNYRPRRTGLIRFSFPL